ncbi:MAG: hypothetical protein WC529_00805 [Candidatus Margulisiibacteriota bacterium]
MDYLIGITAIALFFGVSYFIFLALAGLIQLIIVKIHGIKGRDKRKERKWDFLLRG